MKYRRRRRLEKMQSNWCKRNWEEEKEEGKGQGGLASKAESSKRRSELSTLLATDILEPITTNFFP